MFLYGCYGSGKTHACELKLHLAHCRYPGLRSLVVRKELTTVFDTIIVDLNNDLFKYGLSDDRNPWSVHGGEIKPDRIIYDNGGMMMFRGMDKGEKKLGGNYDIIYMNQAEQFTLDDYNILRSRGRNNRQGLMVYNEETNQMEPEYFHQWIIDANPRSHRNWEKAYAEERGLKMIKFWLTDNALYYDHNTQQWSKKGKNYHDILAQYTGYERERGYLGNYAAAEGLVYRHFNEASHVFNINWGDIPTDWEIYTSRDFGATKASAFCHLAFAVSPDGKQLKQLPTTQIYLSELDIRDISERVAAVEKRIKENLGRPVDVRVADHDGTGQKVLANDGMPAESAQKKVLEGINEVKDFFHPNSEKSIELQAKPRDLAHDPDPKLIGRPQRLLDELLEYAYKTVQDQDRNTDKADHPKKGNDHALDALRYLVMEFKEMPEVTEIATMVMPEQDIYTMDFGGLL